MVYVVTIFQMLNTEVQRHNYKDLPEAIAKANKAVNHPRVRKVEISVILHTMTKP